MADRLFMFNNLLCYTDGLDSIYSGEDHGHRVQGTWLGFRLSVW